MTAVAREAYQLQAVPAHVGTVTDELELQLTRETVAPGTVTETFDLAMVVLHETRFDTETVA